MVVDAAHVRASPLVEVIVEFPPSTALPSLARFGYRLKKQLVGNWAISLTRGSPIWLHVYVPLWWTRRASQEVKTICMRNNR
jgi:hypothetical protein